jgi:hypothetical protein
VVLILPVTQYIWNLIPNFKVDLLLGVFDKEVEGEYVYLIHN